MTIQLSMQLCGTNFYNISSQWSNECPHLTKAHSSNEQFLLPNCARGVPKVQRGKECRIEERPRRRLSLHVRPTWHEMESRVST